MIVMLWGVETKRTTEQFAPQTNPFFLQSTVKYSKHTLFFVTFVKLLVRPNQFTRGANLENYYCDRPPAKSPLMTCIFLEFNYTNTQPVKCLQCWTCLHPCIVARIAKHKINDVRLLLILKVAVCCRLDPRS